MNQMKIVDTHHHLWDLDLFRYSWLGNAPTINRSFRMTDYLHATNGLNVVKSIHLEADVDEPFMLAETRYILELSGQPDNPLDGVVASARPENKDFPSYLEKIMGSPKLKGIRRLLHNQPDEVGQSRTFIKNVSSLASLGLSFDICVLARQLPIAINLVTHCSDVTFILDHCGVPPVKERILDPWRSHISELAKLSNVFCKISGIVAYAEPSAWTADDLRPYIEHVISSFGWDRVLFGSDWPVCTTSSSLARWVETLRKITEPEGEAKQRRLFYDNAVRVYRLS
jgi:predicted TIM-barrel fold metal-dependent hydrolase